jgi:thiamine biosynthesis lipoprotein
MMTSTLNRRAFLSITAVASVGAALWFGRSVKSLVPVRWSGQFMGATADMTLYVTDQEWGRTLIQNCLDEVERLENLFSLFRPNSELSRLNRLGKLSNASADFLDVLQKAQSISRVSAGAFDVTVQPLWTLYSTHFEQKGKDADGPDAGAIRAAIAGVDWQKIKVIGQDVSFAQDKMGATFNSIARGFATDRVTSILRQAGLERALVNMDNYYALGVHPDGRKWHLGVATPKDVTQTLLTLELENKAVASASGYGTLFDRVGKFHHIFDPHSGGCASNWAGCTVVAEQAVTADALSTALLVAPKDQAARILAEGGGDTAYLVDEAGVVTTI